MSDLIIHEGYDCSKELLQGLPGVELSPIMIDVIHLIITTLWSQEDQHERLHPVASFNDIPRKSNIVTHQSERPHYLKDPRHYVTITRPYYFFSVESKDNHALLHVYVDRIRTDLFHVMNGFPLICKLLEGIELTRERDVIDKLVPFWNEYKSVLDFFKDHETWRENASTGMNPPDLEANGVYDITFKVMDWFAERLEGDSVFDGHDDLKKTLAHVDFLNHRCSPETKEAFCKAIRKLDVRDIDRETFVDESWKNWLLLARS